jgi:K+-transporting ATPase ATPase B chain
MKYAALASVFDTTPEGRSILALAQKNGVEVKIPEKSTAIAFTAETRMSGLKTPDFCIQKGAESAICAWTKTASLEKQHPAFFEKLQNIAKQGGTPLLIAKDNVILGGIHLKDIVKPGIKDRFTRIRAMGIRSVMITGDNPLTAAAIAKEAGVDDFFAEAKPEDKMHLIQKYQKEGLMTAMSGDGTNDAPALAQSDVGLVMNTGTQAAREAGNMIDLDSDPTKIIEIVEIGKQLLITRGALTTFSITNDVAKYFAILPALFVGKVEGMQHFNILNLSSPENAVLSAVIFNALIIIGLLPLALKGVNFKPQSSTQLLVRNVLYYGAGGVFVPFLGIKIIDLILQKIL